jgi:hypothetical protein
VRGDDGTRRRVPDEGDEVSFGPRRPDGRWRPGRLLIASVAVLAMVVAVAAVLVAGHGNNPPGARPASTGAARTGAASTGTASTGVASTGPASTGVASTGGAGPRQLSVRGNWELFGYAPGKVVRIQFASGRVTQTAVPPVMSGGPVSFVVGPHEAVIRPLDFVPGYLVPDGRPARLLPGALDTGGTVIPGPQPGTAWVQAGFQVTSMPLVRMDGTATGVSLRLPPGGPWQATADGRGGVLVVDYSGAISDDVRPGGFRRVAGTVTAVGPTRWLVVDCHAGHRCSDAIVDPATGARHTLPGAAAEPSPGVLPGVICPDGSAAAIVSASGDRVTLHLLNLVSGADQRIAVSLDQESADGQTLAWSPDSRWLFVVAAHGELAVVDAHTGHVEGLDVSLPPLSQIAIRYG